MTNYGTSPSPSRLHPISLFAQITSQQASGCLHIRSGTVQWQLYFDQGKLAFATNSVQPFERLDRYLSYLSDRVPTLVNAVRQQVLSLFAAQSPESGITTDWLAIQWLVEQDYLEPSYLPGLVEAIAKDVLESLLVVTSGEHEWVSPAHITPFPNPCALELRPLVEQCQLKLRQSTASATELQGRFQAAQAREFSRANQPPASNLPQHAHDDVTVVSQRRIPTSSPTETTKTYTIACIDDSPTVLQAIHSFLDDSNVSIVMINDPLKALIQIVRCKPDLILLDVGMPNLDGYELCSMLRRHSSLKTIPIVMVTGHTGFIDRAKAKLVGASGYLTKPFTRPELVKMVFKFLT
jgi:two-component system, chemotaxis family, response regulator PixG